MLYAFSPDRSAEFGRAMTQAWEWMQRRKRFYCDRGVNQSLNEYLRTAAAEDTKQLGVIGGDTLIAIITVQLAYEGIFQIHVTAAPKADRAAILSDLLHVRDDLFDRLHAREVWTSCGTHRGHKNKASYALAAACGMIRNGVAWESLHDPDTIWEEFFISREMYGRAKIND